MNPLSCYDYGLSLISHNIIFRSSKFIPWIDKSCGEIHGFQSVFVMKLTSFNFEQLRDRFYLNISLKKSPTYQTTLLYANAIWQKSKLPYNYFKFVNIERHRFQIKNSLIWFYERTQLSYTQDADPHLSYQHQHLGKIIVRLAVSRNWPSRNSKRTIIYSKYICCLCWAADRNARLRAMPTRNRAL